MISLYVGSSIRRGLDGAHPNSLATHAHTHPMLLDNEDAESGKGPSLPMSPHSVDGAIGGPAAKPYGLTESSDDEMNKNSISGGGASLGGNSQK